MVVEVQSRAPHISICVCTYRRPNLLKALLRELGRQKTNDQFAYSIIVVDNDADQSAAEVVNEAAKQSACSIQYAVEAQQNISMARNKAVQLAEGDYIAFIDDDELPGNEWLLTLFGAMARYDVDGVLGPVRPKFETAPPRWIITGRFYDRPSYPSGYVIDGPKGRTGNVLLKRTLFDGADEPFNPQLLTGEDQEFFGRMIAKGHSFVWCEEAVAYELVPPARWKRSFILRRALLRGKVSLLQPTTGAREVFKSLVALPVYLILLPGLFVLSHGWFMKYLVKVFDHAGRLLALFGLNPVNESYVTE